MNHSFITSVTHGATQPLFEYAWDTHPYNGIKLNEVFFMTIFQ